MIAKYNRLSIKNLFIFIISFLLFLPLHKNLLALETYTTHAISLTNTVKYPKDFESFEYTSPKARVNGGIVSSRIGGFDNFNQFILRGHAPSTLNLTYDTLLKQSADEIATFYGLLAKNITIPADKTFVIFEIYDFAKWHDGTRLTTEDIEFTFNILREKGSPIYKIYFAQIKDMVKISPYKIKINYKTPQPNAFITKLGSIPILSKKFFETHDFSAPSLIPILGSGPYIVDQKSIKMNKSLTFIKNKNYWAAGLAVNKNQYNFKTITYKHYNDYTNALKAFKAHEFDFRIENVSKYWHTEYSSIKNKNFPLIKEEVITNLPIAMQAIAFNMRLAKFQDIKTRKAISTLFDFEWLNKNIFYNSYIRNNSFFTNSMFEHQQTLSKEELEVIAEMEAQSIIIDPKIQKEFNRKFISPITTGRGSNRKNLVKASKLLKEAGWEIDPATSILRHNKTKEYLSIEFLLTSPSMVKAMLPFIYSLKKIGIDAKVKQVDTTIIQKRLTRFNFDMYVTVLVNNIVLGIEQYSRWHSSHSDNHGEQNIIGVQNKAVDYLVEKIRNTSDIQEKIPYAQLLDRILLNNHYIIPSWYLNTIRLAYYDKFNKPNITPTYSLPILETWWNKE